MIDATRNAMSVTALASEALHARPGLADRPMRSASALTNGADPITPAAMAISRSGLRYHATLYGVGAAAPSPASAFRNAIAPPSVSARKNTQPIITTSIV